MRKSPRLVLACVLLVASCAQPPATAPEVDPLIEWLMTSETAQAIGDAARDQSWLSDAEPPGRVGDLRAVMSAARIDSVAELDQTLRPAASDMEQLLRALRQRRPGSTRGDLAHWVGVALLTFSDVDADTAQIPESELWDDDYLDDIFELRAIAARGNLENAARPAVIDLDPPPEDLAFRPPGWYTLVAARADSTSPVFETPSDAGITGWLYVAGAVQFAAGETVRFDDYLLAVKRAGRARVRVDYVATVAHHRLSDEGRLDFVGSGNLAVRADQELTVLARSADERYLWIWLGDGQVAKVPVECCGVPEGLDTLLWLRLKEGAFKGKWVPVPEEDFGDVSWEQYWTAETAPDRGLAARQQLYPPMGSFDSQDTARPEIAGARLAVWRSGVAEGAPLFVVHGAPGLGSAYLRAPLTQTIGTERQLLFYDQRGSGYSEGADDPASLTMSRMVDDLDLLRQRAELEQIDLVAHGFGGLVALRYALLYQHRVRRLVLIEPEPGSYGEWVAFLEEVEARRAPADRREARFFEERIALLEASPRLPSNTPIRMAVFGLRQRAFTADPDAADRLDFALTDDVLDNWAVTRNALRDDLGGWDLHGDLPSISVPTLIVAGDHGALTGAERLHSGLANSELVVLPGVGHYPFVEAPEQFARVVLDFLWRTDR